MPLTSTTRKLLCEGAGDVLMQVAFHAQIEREAGHFPLQRSATVSAVSCLTAIRTFFRGDESIKRLGFAQE